MKLVRFLMLDRLLVGRIVRAIRGDAPVARSRSKPFVSVLALTGAHAARMPARVPHGEAARGAQHADEATQSASLAPRLR